MLPPAHIAAGYIAAKEVIHLVPFNFSVGQQHALAIAGMFAGFAPDLDFFYAFAQIGKMRIDNSKVNHRKLFTHAPLVWLAAGILIFAAATAVHSDFYKTLAIIIWAGSWTHFILDSEWGIMWLWPFSRQLYPFSKAYYANKYAHENPTSPNMSFIQYWFAFLERKSTELSSYLEIAIVIIALAIALHK